ncbi:glycine-rich domain-containing protein [Pseudomonas japonica]|uniref:Glycine-rich domain-containing protein n=1 Tax=Pseudomonas japonica TaxID=256466 RepID=A0A239KXD6_9PSED|nr:hypothetical protein [Pseudomonas japonica]SNT22715.1 hypothetical protein SAMN05444352_1302 [Pseudomonas japonica]
MASLPEQYDWAPGIYQLETSDPVLGGPEGIDNLQAKQLASRTQWLKNQLAAGGVNVVAPQVVGKIADLGVTRFISTTEQTTDRPGGIDYAAGIHVAFPENGYGFDLLAGVSSEQFLVRKNVPGAPGAWRFLFHSGNFNPGEKADKATSLAGYGVTFATQGEAEAGSDPNKPMSALRVAQAIASRLFQATETALGIAKIATQALVNARVDDSTMVTPRKLATQLPLRGVAVYETPGVFSWLVPPGVSKAWVEVYGGGGGGAMSSTAPGASGGGGGGVAMKLVALTPGDAVMITVGLGGNGASADKASGSAGGASSFGSFCSATGGFGGHVDSTLGAPGTGTGGDINYRIGIGAGPITPPAGGLHGGAGGGGESAAAGVDTTRPSQPGMGGGGRISGGGAPGAHGAVRIYY